jgi:CHASE2 domain-containing sensor protein
MRWRVLMAVFGAVPATVLGIGAFMGAIAGGQGLTANWVQSLLLLAWGVLGVAGVVGLWLAVLDRDPRLAVPLTACGLIAAAPLIVGLIVALMVGGPPWLLPVALTPFGFGVAYIVGSVRRRRRRRPADQ